MQEFVITIQETTGQADKDLDTLLDALKSPIVEDDLAALRSLHETIDTSQKSYRIANLAIWEIQKQVKRRIKGLEKPEDEKGEKPERKAKATGGEKPKLQRASEATGADEEAAPVEA